MNAFAGLFHRDGRPARHWPGEGIASLVSRGVRCAIDSGPTILAGAGMEALDHEKRRPGLIVAADVRLDNRAEIKSRLGLPPRPALPEASLIAALYERYGADCASMLLGDFAFVLWDEATQTLFGARDHFGVRPFYYHASPRLFMAATTIGALLSSEISSAIDEVGAADFVAGIVGDAQTTLYREIRRLPPGHVIQVTRDELTISRYWHLAASQPPKEEETAEQFRHLFEQAVSCRISEQAGVMLSGGLDSSSIAMMASRLRAEAAGPPVPSLSMTFDTSPNWTDGPHIEAILQAGRFTPHFLPTEHQDPLQELDMILAEQDGPCLAYNLGSSRRLYHRARQLGLPRLLDGHGGDEVVSHGFGRLNELAMERRWATLLREAHGLAHILRCSTWQAASPHFDHIATIRQFRQNWRRIVHHAHPPRTSPNFTTALVAPDLVRRTDIGFRRAATMPSRSAYQTEQQRHLSTLTSPQQPYAFEVLDRSAAAAGVRLCFPFYDRRLVEFCVSLPAHAKLDNGYPRASLRNAMAGLLPEQVRLRRDKFNFAGQLGTGMARHRASLLTMLDAQADMLAPFVDIDVARAAITQFDQSMANDAAPLFAAYRIASLGRWLARRSRPAAPRAKFHIVHAGG